MIELKDVSEAQGDIDWAKWPDKAVFVRTNDGDHRDTRWTPERVKAIRAAGITLAPYAFARVAARGNGWRSGTSEMAMILAFAHDGGWRHPGDLPLFYDFEEASLNSRPPKECAKHLLDALRAYEKVIGSPAGVYTDLNVLRRLTPVLSADDTTYLSKCHWWIASWGVSPDTLRKQVYPIAPWMRIAVQQYSDNGTAGGKHPIDLNRVLIPDAEFLALANPSAPAPKPSPVPKPKPAPSKFVIVKGAQGTCAPVPARMATLVQHCLTASGARIESGYRGDDAAKELAACHKHSQKYLYEHQGTQGIGPANPPGHSTHECRNGPHGYPYAGIPDGGKLRSWQCGLDIDDAHVNAFIAAGKKIGADFYRPYSSGSEHHHLNLRAKPKNYPYKAKP